MPVIYNITIEPTDRKNYFHITWYNVGTNVIIHFDQEADIMPDETQLLWQKSSQLLAIGQKIFRFLDGDSHYMKKALDESVRYGEPLIIWQSTNEKIAEWPFELLAHDKSFLLPERVHMIRCISNWGVEKMYEPKARPLKLLFMVCSPLDVQRELNFEKEEETVFKVTENLALEMEVDDTCSLEGLRQKLRHEEFDVIHLSGYADIDKNGQPFFIMENETGNSRHVYPDQLWNDALIENPPRLLFLSGRRTGEIPGIVAISSFATAILENYHIPAILGLGLSVSDLQAIHAGKIIYHELSRGKTIIEAVQRTRYELIKNFPNTPNSVWPLLRLFSTGEPPLSIVEKEQKCKPESNTH